MIDGAESAVLIHTIALLTTEQARRQAEGRVHQPVLQAYLVALSSLELLQQRLADEDSLRAMQASGHA